ncbi:MAG: adenine phosphoribosyltransferase [Actinomycetota bacterium]
MDEADDGVLRSLIRDVPDFPEPGILFKDITPLLADAEAFALVVDRLAEHFVGQHIDKVVGVEARGFVLAAPVAHRLGAGLVPVRKPGKLPWETHAATYELEYGSDRLEVHQDAVAPGERVVVIDDVLATGGTAAATAQLIETLGGEVVGLGFLIELAFLGGAARLEGRDLVALLTYR